MADTSTLKKAKLDPEVENAEEKFSIILYYLYVDIPDVQSVIDWHVEFGTKHNFSGRVLVSSQGINGTLGGDKESIIKYTKEMNANPLFASVEWKHSTSHVAPFPDLSVKEVKEIISTGGKINFDMAERGDHLRPSEFDKLLREHEKKDDLVLIDCRNDKEYMIGHFDGAINPKTRFFSEWTDWVDKNVGDIKGKTVAMYCTGGVRCELGSVYLKYKGCKDVFQLHGGIHKYLEEFPDGGKFHGKNFVFDRRNAMTAEQASEERKVVGTCYSCDEPFDSLCGDRVCTVCRDVLLVCDKCRVKLSGEYHCELHRNVESCYFTYLDVFTPEELEKQKEGLQKEWDALLGNKNKRRTIRKQIDRVEQRLAQLVSGEAKVASREEVGIRCRNCGTVDCEGRCWGFWAQREHPL